MHIKQRSDDFHVEEKTDLEPCQEGDYALYRLEKRGWTTPDAVGAIRRRWRIQPWRFSYGGLKDRHAHTIQYISILRGPQRRFTQEGIALTYLGRLSHPFLSENIAGNRFALTLRDATTEQIEIALAALEEIREIGVPNYFDDQRFGSVDDGGPFMASLLVRGDAEGALKIALTGPYRFDRAAVKREKALLRQHWGDWPRLRELLPPGHARGLVDYLSARPEDFHGAVVRLRPELRGLYLSAYQSHLWNRMLARWLEAHFESAQLIAVPLRLGALPMHRSLTESQRTQLAALALPLHSARIRLEETDARKPFFDAVLAEEGVTQEQLKLKGSRDLFFSKGERAALCLPTNLAAETGQDASHPGRQTLTLRFDLPRGSYATLIVKRATRVPDEE